MFKSVSHYILRSRELGPFGLLRHVWARSKDILFVLSQSLWWGWKARQEMSDADLLAHTTGSWRSVETLLDHLASRPASSFLLPHESPQETTALLYQHYSEYVSAVLATADAACRNELSLLGHAFHFSPGINWQCDPVTGWRWPLLHRSRVGQYLGATRPVDLIIFWEMNRHQHYISLGIAYWLTGDQRYVEAFCSQVLSWIETNPLQLGVNWYYPLEVSIRIIAWTAAFQFFRDSVEFREKAGKAFLKSLWEQADFLSNHLQITRSDVPNNHMMAELTGLVLVGAAFPEFRTAEGWRETGLRLLNQQVPAQTYPDGVNKEQAIGYHRFIAELLLLLVVRSRQGALPHESILEDALERMLDYVFYTLTPVGTAPMWGDSDYGRALGLGQNKDFWDFRPLLSAGAALFGRADWKFAAGRFDEEAFWLLGSGGLERWQQLDVRPPEQTSRAFPHAGLYVIRNAWTVDTDVAFFRCGPFGLGGEGHCSHSHCDLLSPLLWIDGRELLVDSGTFLYSGQFRNDFRLTAAHNTLMVNGYDQAMPRYPFGWQSIPIAEMVDWEARHRVIGIMQIAPGLQHIRELLYDTGGCWEITDQLSGEGTYNLSWFFHFASRLSLRWINPQSVLLVEENNCPFVKIVLPAGVDVVFDKGWYSPRYGYKVPSPMLHSTWLGHIHTGGISFSWKIYKVQGVMEEM